VPESTSPIVQVKGHRELLQRFRDPLECALVKRSKYYVVQVERVGRLGEILVSVTGASGRLPLLFGRDDGPDDVTRVVLESVARLNL
jgi:hypothetical protein